MNNQTHQILLAEYQTRAHTFQKLKQKLVKSYQAIASRLNIKKVETYLETKYNRKDREVFNMLCNSFQTKAQTIFVRQGQKIFEENKINQNLKIYDYITDREKYSKQIGTDPFQYYNQEEECLQQLIAFLTNYLNEV